MLNSIEARYRDLLNRLGVNGHDGAIAEIIALRERASLSDKNATHTPPNTACSGLEAAESREGKEP